MAPKTILKYLAFLLSVFFVSLNLTSCYEVKTEVIGKTESVQIKNLLDGSYQNEQKDIFKVKWEAAAQEYALEFITKEDTTPCRGRLIPLHEAYWLLQIFNPEEEPPYTVFIVTVEKNTVTAFTAQDEKLEVQLAVKSGVVAGEEEFHQGKLAEAKPAAMRAFLKALAASATLKAEVSYKYIEPPKTSK